MAGGKRRECRHGEAHASVTWNFDALHLDLTRAALDTSHWKPALQRLSSTVGAVGRVLLPPVSHRFAAISTDEIGEASDRYFREGWNSRDLRDRGIRKMLQRGVTVDLDFATEEEFRRSDYYKTTSSAATGCDGLRASRPRRAATSGSSRSSGRSPRGRSWPAGGAAAAAT